MNKDNQPMPRRSDDAQVIRPPHLLQAKVASVPVRDPDALFAAVDRAIAAKADVFLENARDDLGAMRIALHEAVTVTEKRAEGLERVFTIAHDLKGQGSSFGYPLITKIGGLLCQFLRARRGHDAQGLRIAAAHIEALAIVLEHRIAGEGGQLGASVVERLEKLVGAAEDEAPV